MNKIKILIVDDIKQIREHFTFILSQETDMEVVGEAGDGKSAYLAAQQLHPDIILMDIAMETETAGIDAVKKIKEEMEHVKILMLTIHQHEELMFQAYMNGAMDYLTKTSSVVEIIGSIRNVYANKLNLRPEISQKVIAELNRLKNNESSMIYTLNIISKLTTAEFEVLKSLYMGKNYKEIARERFVEEVTLRTQVNKILKKFNAHKLGEVLSMLKQMKIFDIYLKE